MTDKKKILLLHRAYPVSISKYFLEAFRHRDDVEITDVSPYFGSYIPWKGGMHLPEKYKTTPTYVLPFDYPEVPWPIVDNLTGHQEWDMILTIDPMIHWSAQPTKNCPVVHVGTDPHVIDYSKPRGYSDFFFNMQQVYSQPGDIYLPYAFSKYHFYPQENQIFSANDVEKEWDASLVGLQYAERLQWVASLRNAGYKVFSDTGPAFDEYREITWKSKVVLSWSSKQDLICRVFEAMAMGVPLVMNRVPDILSVFPTDELFWIFDGDRGSRSVSDATELVKYVLGNSSEFNNSVTEKAKQVVFSKHTFDHRVESILHHVFTSPVGV